MADRKLIKLKFQVKIKSLADESRTIRESEHKCVFVPRKGEDPIQAAKRLVESDRIRTALTIHRKDGVGWESRHAYLAYAFWRKRAYLKTESASARLVSEGKLPVGIELKRVAQILRSIAEMSVSITEVEDWIMGKAEQPRQVSALVQEES